MIEQKVDRLNARADANGDAWIELPKVPAGEQWIVDRLAIACTADVNTPAAVVYVGDNRDDVTDQDHVDSTPNASRAASEYPAGGLLIPSNRALIIRFYGADVGAFAYVHVQYRRGPATSKGAR